MTCWFCAYSTYHCSCSAVESSSFSWTVAVVICVLFCNVLLAVLLHHMHSNCNDNSLQLSVHSWGSTWWHLTLLAFCSCHHPVVNVHNVSETLLEKFVVSVVNSLLWTICYGSTVYTVGLCLSVCSSLCLSQANIISKQLNIGSCQHCCMILQFFYAKDVSEIWMVSSFMGVACACGVGQNWFIFAFDTKRMRRQVVFKLEVDRNSASASVAKVAPFTVLANFRLRPKVKLKLSAHFWFRPKVSCTFGWLPKSDGYSFIWIQLLDLACLIDFRR